MRLRTLVFLMMSSVSKESVRSAGGSEIASRGAGTISAWAIGSRRLHQSQGTNPKPQMPGIAGRAHGLRRNRIERAESDRGPGRRLDQLRGNMQAPLRNSGFFPREIP